MGTIKIDGLSVAVTDVGAGPPVVLLHGLGCGRRMWFHQIRALRRRFRVIAYDLRGHGQSDAPVDATDYSAARSIFSASSKPMKSRVRCAAE